MTGGRPTGAVVSRGDGRSSPIPGAMAYSDNIYVFIKDDVKLSMNFKLNAMLLGVI